MRHCESCTTLGDIKTAAAQQADFFGESCGGSEPWRQQPPTGTAAGTTAHHGGLVSSCCASDIVSPEATVGHARGFDGGSRDLTVHGARWTITQANQRRLEWCASATPRFPDSMQSDQIMTTLYNAF